MDLPQYRKLHPQHLVHSLSHAPNRSQSHNQRLRPSLPRHRDQPHTLWLPQPYSNITLPLERKYSSLKKSNFISNLYLIYYTTPFFCRSLLSPLTPDCFEFGNETFQVFWCKVNNNNNCGEENGDWTLVYIVYLFSDMCIQVFFFFIQAKPSNWFRWRCTEKSRSCGRSIWRETTLPSTTVTNNRNEISSWSSSACAKRSTSCQGSSSAASYNAESATQSTR